MRATRALGLAYDEADMSGSAPPNFRHPLRESAPKRVLRRLLRRNKEGLNVAPGNLDDGWESPPPVSLADGSTVQLYKDGEALRKAYEAIEAAQSRICFEFYIWDDDATGRAFADLLLKKAKEGVNVYILYDRPCSPSSVARARASRSFIRSARGSATSAGVLTRGTTASWWSWMTSSRVSAG
jgi:phosphatidylserine/phosphatidylglycerophosphate/cardiolipin synthase-like enzyme